MEFQKKDKEFMLEAIRIAKKGKGRTKTNPLVGCVLVKNNEIIAKGYHSSYGKKHAEIDALNKTKEQGLTLYVNLEPCCHHGKTPPCVDEIIKRKVKTVFIGMKDPNKEVNGQGLKKLKQAGIKVHQGCLEHESRLLNYSYLTGIKKNRASVTIKVATSLDGKVAACDGTSQWITSKKSRSDGKKMRNRYDAILVGSGTASKDNPVLNRSLRPESWKKILIDRKNKVKESSRMFKNGKIYIWGGAKNKLNKKIKYLEAKNLKNLLELLRKDGVQSVLCEGGKLSSELIKDNLADKIVTYISPKLIGSKGLGFSPAEWKTLSDSRKLSDVGITKIGEDVKVEGYLTNVHRNN